MKDILNLTNARPMEAGIYINLYYYRVLRYGEIDRKRETRLELSQATLHFIRYEGIRKRVMGVGWNTLEKDS